MSVSMLGEHHLSRLAGATELGVLTLGELVALGEELKLPLSQMVVGEAMLRENKSFDQILDECFAAFEHNLKALDKGLENGNSFVLGTVATDLARQASHGQGVLIDDVLMDRALIYTLAAEAPEPGIPVPTPDCSRRSSRPGWSRNGCALPRR
ncbi:MAG: hypothetical protein NT123_12000 [Proteobacteria bacterium]|nr:hypothetical protein [Pseudomonadota bacterium]